MASIRDFIAEQQLEAAYIATCVGSLQKCTLRMANADRDHKNEIKSYEQRFEILSLVGTVSKDGAHVHIGLSDSEGACVGGHLISGEIFTTAEIVIGCVPNIAFARRYDDATGFPELEVQRKERNNLRAIAAVGIALLSLSLVLSKRQQRS